MCNQIDRAIRMYRADFKIEDIEFIAEWILQFKGKEFQHKKITYVENQVRDKLQELNYLISVDIVEDSLIIGFCENSDYEPIDKPIIHEENEKGITLREIRSKDKKHMSYIWVDFTANHLLFTDRLKNGFVIYKTNSRKDIDTKVLKQRWIFREEFIIKEK